MRTSLLMAAMTATSFFIAGCEKEGSAPQQQGPSVPGEVAKVVEAAVPPLASHLGIATLVPADADLFLAGYGADEIIQRLINSFLERESSKKITGEKRTEMFQKLGELKSGVGDEAFLFIGPGLGEQLGAMGATYRGISAAMLETTVSSLLRTADPSANPADTYEIDEKAAAETLDKLLAAFEKDAQLKVPSVVAGWKPAPDHVEKLSKDVTEGLAAFFAEVPESQPVNFEASGVTFTGHELKGRQIFGKIVAEARKNLEGNKFSDRLPHRLAPENIERFLAAVENVRFTVATGKSEGRVILYLGNGKEGFRLAAKPEESLAAGEGLKWTQDFATKRILGAAYLSEPMIRSVLPWLDSSAHWDALGKAVGPPIREVRVFRELFAQLAENDRELAKRDASAWSMLLVEDAGWRLESRGGWPDPTLDYNTPLRMTAPALAQKPAIRAHWVQNRSRNDLEWQRVELLGVTLEAGLKEAVALAGPQAGVPADAVISSFMSEVRNFNRAYREEFRRGVGDEVAFVADFKGEIPTLPGIPEEVIRDGRMPRFVMARDVKDRALLDAAGKSYAEIWRKLTAVASEAAGTDLPLILPQKMEAGDLTTWFAPAPFIGGDFVPGVSLNDKVWMFGTSPQLAKGMAAGMATPASSGETGMIVEIEFAPMREWLADVAKRSGANPEAMIQSVEEGSREMFSETLNGMIDTAGKVQGISYRQWLDSGKPRTSLHLRMAE